MENLEKVMDNLKGVNMEEISKEEAIKYFKKRIEVEKKVVSLPTCDKEVAEIKKKHIAIFEQAISEMEKLDSYETKLKNAYGECDTLLDVVVDGLVKQAEEHKIGQPRKSRLLTDEHVDAWERAKSDREKLLKIEQIIKDSHNNAFIFRDGRDYLDEIEQIVKE